MRNNYLLSNFFLLSLFLSYSNGDFLISHLFSSALGMQHLSGLIQRQMGLVTQVWEWFKIMQLKSNVSNLIIMEVGLLITTKTG